MDFSNKTYRNIRSIGFLCIATGVFIILSYLFNFFDYLFFDGYGNISSTIKQTIFRGLTTLFLFMLGSSCLRIKAGQDNTYYWEAAFVMLRNYLFVAIFVAVGWFVTSFLPF